MAEDDLLPTLITLEPEDVQAIVAGLAANPNTIATMAHFMVRATSNIGSSDQPALSDQLASSSSSQGPSNSKLHLTITTIRDTLWLTPPILMARLA